MLFAIDHGNKNIKTILNAPFISGMQESITKPYGKEVLQYQNRYYMLSGQRMPYMRDKTVDERFFILTLFAIAKELDALGCPPDQTMSIKLAVGLPPDHYAALHQPFTAYFNRQEQLDFVYNGKRHRIYIDDVRCYPQAYAAAITILEDLIDCPKALIVDIGGFTVDYLMMRNGQADLSTCASMEHGVIVLYNQIISKVNAELDILLEESDIDTILKRQTTAYSSAITAIVERQAQLFVNNLLHAFRERMIALKGSKVVFVGGGSVLLKRQIEASGKLETALFVDDIHANAQGYEILYGLETNGGR